MIYLATNNEISQGQLLIDDLTHIKTKIITDLESQTIVHCIHKASAIYINGGWVNIHPNTYLTAGEGQNPLPLIDAIDIPFSPNKHLYSNTKEIKRFTLLFPAIPASWKKFSLIEEAGTENGFIVTDILRNNLGVYHVTLI